ncbi:hypothetical protein CDAR_50471 [Caerostris darwini]|uniref:Uncharacterized protein n=1 Tax=Caerostris darwini TaxID=1538125 RepID=A0AAV4UXF5_9ARAC|nr:hypothetical protein CDAR_50471 [Caerostris darwini]
MQKSELEGFRHLLSAVVVAYLIGQVHHVINIAASSSQGYPMPRFDESGRARDLRPGPSTPGRGTGEFLLARPPAGKDCFEYFATRLRNLSMFEPSLPTRDEYQFITHSLLSFPAVSVPRIF